MYIKSILLDGFKSYAKRTEIQNFDPYFNAITGLNGSGKSNILDGICFVLGISNLSNVRANNLQELIFKSGQSGVTKASVTIIFDNSNKQQSPVGYENFDEITISRIVAMGGRNKYLINGCNSTNSRVSDLFCSVQMNVNNPHFLIMQGRVTKVLNMKPAEILSMVEEAVGTKMYERKRQLALDTMAKKDLKLNEINLVCCDFHQMLNDDIIPTITKLREERTSYLEYQKINREYEHTQRIFRAFEYFNLKKKKIQHNLRYKELSEEKDKLFNHSTELNFKVKQIENDICRLQQEFDKVTLSIIKKSGNEFRTKQTNFQALSERDIAHTSELQHSHEKLKQMKRLLEKVNIDVKNIEKNIENNENKKISISKELEEIRNQKDTLDSQLEHEAKLLQSATIGISDSALQPQSITELQASSNRLTLMQSNLDSIQKKIKQHNIQLKEKEAEFKSCLDETCVEEKQLDHLENELATLNKLIEKQDFQSEIYDDYLQQHSKIKSEISEIFRSIEDFESKNPSLVFNHNMLKHQDFKKQVFGMVSSLFDVVDERFVVAIESAAGGKLFNVVVDHDETTKQLIKSGTLKRRVTFISLNRVTSNQIDRNSLEYAKNLVGGDKIWEAASLVECDKVIRPAINFVFGNTIICETSKEAKKLAYDRNLNCRCVTLDGDVFESSGTLTGGSRPTQNSLLMKQKELRYLKKSLINLTEKEETLSDYISKCKQKHETCTKLRQNIDDRSLELDLLKSKLKSSNRFLIQDTIADLKKIIESAKDDEKGLLEDIEVEKKNRSDLEEKTKNETAFREETIKKHKKNVDNIKRNVDRVNKEIVKLEPMVIDLGFQNEELNTEKLKLTARGKEFLIQIEECELRIKKLEEIISDTKQELASLEQEIEEIKQHIIEQNEHIQIMNSRKSELDKELFEIQLKSKEIDQNISSLKHNINQTSIMIQEMLDQNTWIESEEKNFNIPDSVYNFSVLNFAELKDRMNWLEDSVKKLKRTVNTRAMNMLSQAEEKFNDLMRKKKIVENDRNKIQSMIKDLDVEKNEALKSSSIKVNKDFGSIFSTLLPGADAKLCLIENKNILQGLEICVGFNNTWKESLNELSGGQRSLVALSLILSLLLFKPAPIYILDEIDAALDISHTQNIGVMLQTHFRQSQFIIVSLKDGLFSNANVLFKTKFVNGVSHITRHVQEHRGNQKENDLPHPKKYYS